MMSKFCFWNNTEELSSSEYGPVMTPNIAPGQFCSQGRELKIIRTVLYHSVAGNSLGTEPSSPPLQYNPCLDIPASWAMRLLFFFDRERLQAPSLKKLPPRYLFLDSVKSYGNNNYEFMDKEGLLLDGSPSHSGALRSFSATPFPVTGCG